MAVKMSRPPEAPSCPGWPAGDGPLPTKPPYPPSTSRPRAAHGRDQQVQTPQSLQVGTRGHALPGPRHLTSPPAALLGTGGEVSCPPSPSQIDGSAWWSCEDQSWHAPTCSPGAPAPRRWGGQGSARDFEERARKRLPWGAEREVKGCHQREVAEEEARQVRRLMEGQRGQKLEAGRG